MEFVLYETRDRVAAITLDRPETRNAQNPQLLDELDECWSRAAADDAVRVIVLKANGPHFSSGHDMAMNPDDVRATHFEEKGLEAIYGHERVRFLGYSRKWRDVPKPSIAAVQGACIAGGLMLAWPCDLILAAEDAFFSDPVVRMGIGGVEYHGHTWEFGARKAKELLFTAGRFDAHEAHRLGMVNRVVPAEKLEEETFALAEEIAQMHPFALAQAKRVVNNTLDMMGQYNALQAAFDVHTMGHGNAISVTGRAVMMDLDGMKKAQR